MEKSARQAGLEKDQGQQDMWVWVREVWVGDKDLDDGSAETLFKATNLDSITCDVSTDRKNKEVQGLSAGYSNIEKMRQ